MTSFSEFTEPGFTERADLDAATQLPPGPGAGSSYIEKLLDITSDEAKNYVLAATAEVAVVVFLFKDSIQLVKSAGLPYQIGAAVSAGFLMLSAAGFFVYALEVNTRRLAIARTLLTNDTRLAWELWFSHKLRRSPHPLPRRFEIFRTLALVGIYVGGLVAAVTIVALLLSTRP